MNAIQKLRNKKGLTQEQLATVINVDRSAVAKWETGEAAPKSERLPDIAKALDCTIDDLFEKEQ